MNTCEYRHEAIAFTERTCPLCYVIGKMEQEIEGLNGDLKALQKEIDSHECPEVAS